MKYKEKGVKYNSTQDNMLFTIKGMLELAKKQDAFCYSFDNGVPFIVEPEMSFNEATQALHASKTGKTKIAFVDYMDYRFAGDIYEEMEKMAKDCDFVISNINGTIFRIKKDMTAEDALNTVNNIRQADYLKDREKNYCSPELTDMIKDEVFEPYDEKLWKLNLSYYRTGRDMERVEILGRVMSHLMKKEQQEKPNKAMLAETLNIVNKNTPWDMGDMSDVWDNIFVYRLIATWKHGEELADSMKDINWEIDDHRKSFAKGCENIPTKFQLPIGYECKEK